MNIDRTSFRGRLLNILEDLSACHFVAFDLEMSGIPTNRPGKPTLQERYEDIKAAAERYQILQAGLTFVMHDFDKDTYILKPYNFNLTPMLDECMDIDRDFTFSSSALTFLHRNGFDLNPVLRTGVPYLSPQEATKAKDAAYNRLKRQPETIDTTEFDADALCFFEDARRIIAEWRQNDRQELYIVASRFVAEDGHQQVISGWLPSEEPTDEPLTRYQKRLLHQLVRAEYPDLVTVSREWFMKIIPLDEEREKEVVRKKKHVIKEDIKRQTGFRWIVDAMVGKSLHALDPLGFAYHDNGAPKATRANEYESRFGLVCENLKPKRPVLVGHNCFMDMVYFWHNFIGPLPELVDDFKDAVRATFPLVIDTKYMATHNCGTINPSSSLSEIENKLLLQEKPKIWLHSDHVHYGEVNKHHEAGYDSYLTATVAIKLSAKLETMGKYLPRKRSIPIANGGFSADSSSPTNSLSTDTDRSSADGDLLTGGAPLPGWKVAKRKHKAKRDSTRNSNSSADAASENANMGAMPIVCEKTSNLVISDRDAGAKSTSPKRVAKAAAAKNDMSTIPPWDCDFWRVYGNKFRMFGTVEGVVAFD